MKKKTYYGYYVDELTGDVVNLKPRKSESRPAGEQLGWSFSKWFDNKAQRDKTKKFTLNEIKNIRERRKLRSVS